MLDTSLLAYLDPGTGSIILQAIVGGLAAAAVTVRLWWARVKSIFSRIFRRGEPKSGTERPSSDTAA